MAGWGEFILLWLCSKLRVSLLEKYMKGWIRTEDLNIFILPRMILLCQIRSMKEQDKEKLSLYLHKYFSEFRTLSHVRREGIIQTTVQALVKTEHSRTYLGFSQNLAPRLLDSVWWFDNFVWLIPSARLFLHMFLIRYHFIIAEQEGCELSDIHLGKPAAWFGLYEQMQFLFNLLKHRDYLQHMLQCDT